MKIPVFLIGGGGHCRSVIDLLEKQSHYSVAGILEKAGSTKTEVLGFPVVGTDDRISAYLDETTHALITVGQIKTPTLRKRLYESVLAVGTQMPVVTSRTAYVSKYAQVGHGSCIFHGAVINAAAKVGNNCILNNQCLIEHDVEIGDHCHISTGAKVNGGTSVGEGSFVGSGAILKNGISIGPNSVIGAGCVILTDLPENSLVKQTIEPQLSIKSA